MTSVIVANHGRDITKLRDSLPRGVELFEVNTGLERSAQRIVDIYKCFKYFEQKELAQCTVGGHEPSCIKCPHCHEWISSKEYLLPSKPVPSVEEIKRVLADVEILYHDDVGMTIDLITYHQCIAEAIHSLLAKGE
jgi:hypothetical protein